MSGLAKLATGTIGAFVFIAAVGLLFWARPTPILGVDSESLAHSVEKNPRFDKCLEGPEGDWICAISGTRYEVDVRWDGCWNGAHISGPVTTYTPEKISGCVNLQDHLRLEEALN